MVGEKENSGNSGMKPWCCPCVCRITAGLFGAAHSHNCQLHAGAVPTCQGCVFYQRMKLVVPRRAKNTEEAMGPQRQWKARGWGGEGGQEGMGFREKRISLRVAEREKQETAVQPGSSRDRTQRIANGGLLRSGWWGRENPGRGPRQKPREDTEAESTWDRVNERALSQKQEVRRSWVFWVFFSPCWIEPWL